MTTPTLARPIKMTSSHNMSAPTETLAFLRALHRNDAGELAIFSARRSKDRLVEPRTDYFTLPDQAEVAAAHAVTEAAKGREAYACAHRLTERRRVKEAAAPVTALWADGDLGQVPAGFPAPSVRVASSPGREQWYWRLTRPIAPAQAEDLNRRIARLTGADGSGWDLGQLLRIPGTPNRKYPDAPLVRTIHAGPEAYDPDDLDRLLPALPPPATAAPRTELASGDDDGVEPPVRLDPAGLALWRGEWFARKHDAPSEVDRSESLWRLACVLDEAGATGSTIAAALAERDMTLGWEKYATRRDAAEQYAAIVAKLAHRPRTTSPTAVVKVPTDFAERFRILEQRVATLEQENQDLREANRRLSLLQSRTMAAFRSKALGPEKGTGVALAHELAARTANAPTIDGWHAIPHKRLADQAGVSDQTVPNHLDKIERLGVIERAVRWVPEHVDESTGEIVPGRKQTFIRPKVDPLAMLEVLASATPDPAKPKGGWGGKRVACPEHPSAGTVKRWSTHCAECDRLLDQGEEHQAAEGNRQDDRIPPAPDTGPLADVDNHYRSANRPASHNSIPSAAPPGTIAAAWQAGQSLPGFDAPQRAPLDPWTDVAHGRASP